MITKFDSNFFSEIITGMSEACDGVEVQQLLTAATQIYLAGHKAEMEIPRKEGEWKKIVSEERTVRIYKMVECPFCSKKSVVFAADRLDYCAGCGARLKTT